MRWKSPRFSSALLFAGLLVSGCKPRLLNNDQGDVGYGVDVTWHGQSCFTLRDSMSRTLVIDPFDETVGYGRIYLRADALLITHNHFDHNFTRAVKSRLMTLDLMDSTGTVTVGAGVNVMGIASYHDNEGGEINGPNHIFTWMLGGLKFVHLGDLGQDRLTAGQIAMIGPVDVLFVPVGGVTTIDAARAKEVVETLRPSVVFPMHYGNIRFYRLDDVAKFTALFPADHVKKLEQSTVRIRRLELKEKPEIYILKPTERNF